MKIRNIGIILIVVGIAMMVYTGFNFVTTENILDVGDLHIDKQKNHVVKWSPIAGVLCLSGGLVMLFVGRVKV